MKNENKVTAFIHDKNSVCLFFVTIKRCQLIINSKSYTKKKVEIGDGSVHGWTRFVMSTSRDDWRWWRVL